MTRFDFVPEKLTGTVWLNGLSTLQRVFRGSGRYVFYFADNMDTEPENTYAMALSVQFVE